MVLKLLLLFQLTFSLYSLSDLDISPNQDLISHDIDLNNRRLTIEGHRMGQTGNKYEESKRSLKNLKTL